jgi:leader peptidase (prepilin peptidase) / N-methyltransferase
MDWWFDLPVAAAAVVALLFGLLAGSFLNVVIYRLPKILQAQFAADCASTEDHQAQPEFTYKYLLLPGSACPKCGHQIRWYENIPVVSWLVLRRRCSACKTPIPARYPLVELSGGLLCAAAVLAFGPASKALLAMVLLLALLALTFIDADTFLLPDDITLPLLWLGLIANLFELFVPLSAAVAGAIAGYLSLWLVYWAFKLVTKKEGMGYGDFKLMAALGAWLGWAALPAIILLSAVVGAVVGITMMIFKRLSRGQPLPFGPYIAGAGALALFFGPQINAWYLGTLR